MPQGFQSRLNKLERRTRNPGTMVITVTPNSIMLQPDPHATPKVYSRALLDFFLEDKGLPGNTVIRYVDILGHEIDDSFEEDDDADTDFRFVLGS